MLAAIFVAASTLANLTVDVGVNSLQNLSDTIYRDAFWARPGTPPDLRQKLADEQQETERLAVGSDFRVGAAVRLQTRPASR
jgi:hypothetical protein